MAPLAFSLLSIWVVKLTKRNFDKENASYMQRVHISGRPDVVLYYHKQFMYLLIFFFLIKIYFNKHSPYFRSLKWISEDIKI